MTFKEMIFKGLCDGTVKIISNPNDDCIACQIGEFWFYFIGSEDEDLTPDEVYESYTKEQLTEMILLFLAGGGYLVFYALYLSNILIVLNK